MIRKKILIAFCQEKDDDNFQINYSELQRQKYSINERLRRYLPVISCVCYVTYWKWRWSLPDKDRDNVWNDWYHSYYLEEDSYVNQSEDQVPVALLDGADDGSSLENFYPNPPPQWHLSLSWETKVIDFNYVYFHFIFCVSPNLHNCLI